MSIMPLYALLLVLSSVNCDTLNDVMTLHDTLFANYNLNIRGIMDQTNALEIKASFSLLSLSQLKEVDEAFEVMGLLRLSWTDERLVWNSSQYNGTEVIVVYQDAVWKPEVTLTNPTVRVKALGSDRRQLRINNSGKLEWLIPDMFQAACDIDVIAYPWDRQSCHLEFVVSTFGNNEVSIDIESKQINTLAYAEHKSWDLIKTNAFQSFSFNSRVQFWMCFERRSSFQIWTAFLPIVALSILNAFVLCVRVDSGERISLSVTLLLSITLYLSMVSQSLPTHSKGMSAIIYCLNFVLLESTGICLISILNLHIYCKTGNPPYGCQMIVVKCLGRACGKVNQTDDTDTDNVKAFTDEENTEYKKHEDTVSTTDQNPEITWIDVSLFIDRMFFYLSSLAIILSFLTFSLFVVYNRVECR